MIMNRMPQEDGIKNLYEASLRGSVDALTIFLQNDPLILDRISLTSYTETPLHVASLLGHAEFAEALLHHKPTLAAELDYRGYTPLHLASAEGHTEVVNLLLSIYPDACLVPDQYGRIPLHLAAMRGRVEVIQLLIRANPASVEVKLRGQDQTVLHLCVKYNHFEALALLVAWMRNHGTFWDNGKFLNLADNDGKTILHLAALMNQIETINYLLSIPEVRVEADVMRRIFRNHPLYFENTPINVPPIDDRQPKVWKWFVKLLDRWTNTVENMRGHLMTVATVFASMAFQAAINPPGGILQLDAGDSKYCFKHRGCRGLAGTPMLAQNPDTRDTYNEFLIVNSMSFLLSLSIIGIMLCGFDLNPKLFLIITLVAGALTIYYIGATYVYSLILLGMEKGTGAYKVVHYFSYVGTVSIGIIAALRVVGCGMSKLYKSVVRNEQPAKQVESDTDAIELQGLPANQ